MLRSCQKGLKSRLSSLHVHQPNQCTLSNDKKWAHILPKDLLVTQGIEPHPGPTVKTDYDRYAQDKNYAWTRSDGRWEKINDENDEDNAGKTNMLTRNIRGLFSNLSAALRGRHQIIALQETDIAEHSVPDLIAQAEAAGYKLIFGEPCAMGKDAAKNIGRRVALVIHKDTPCEDATKEGDMYTDFLKASGRWVERLVPLDGGKQMMIASLYGYSGASAMADEYMTNEKLLAAAIMRMRSMGNIPYFIATDMNVDPAVSKIVQMAIEANLAYDIVDDAFGGAPSPTYAKGGITTDMSGPGTTRIDTVLGNDSAAHACKDVRYLHQNNAAFDHVPIEIVLAHDKFTDTINVAQQPARLQIRALHGLTCKQKEDLRSMEAHIYDKIWQHYNNDFDIALVNKDIDECHRIWSRAAEEHLWQLEYSNDPLPTGLPRRGTILPKEDKPIAQKICDVTRVPRNHFTNRVDGIMGLAYDIKARITRLASLRSHPEDDDPEIPHLAEDTVTMDFTNVCAHLHGQHVDAESYDALTLFKTAKRLQTKLRDLPSDVKSAKGSDESHDDNDANAQPDYPRLYDETQDTANNCTRTFTLTRIVELIQITKKIANATVKHIKSLRYQKTAAKLNGKGMQATKDLFHYIKDRCRSPTAAIFDPAKKQYVFDINTQLELMIQHWQSAFFTARRSTA